MMEEAVKPELMDYSFGSNTKKLLPCPTVTVTQEDHEYWVVTDMGFTQTLVKSSLIPAHG